MIDERAWSENFGPFLFGAFISDRVTFIGCYSQPFSMSLMTRMEPRHMPNNPEWPEKKVDPDTLAGLGCQTRSLHEARASPRLMNSTR